MRQLEILSYFPTRSLGRQLRAWIYGAEQRSETSATGLITAAGGQGYDIDCDPRTCVRKFGGSVGRLSKAGATLTREAYGPMTEEWKRFVVDLRSGKAGGSYDERAITERRS